MKFLTTARRKLRRSTSRFLEQTIRTVGREMTLRVLIRSSGSPNCANLAGRPATGLGWTRTEMCLFTNWAEVSGIGLNQEKSSSYV